MSTTPDGVQPDPRDITPDGFAQRADGDDVEGHWINLKATDESGADGIMARADDEGESEGFLRQKH